MNASAAIALTLAAAISFAAVASLQHRSASTAGDPGLSAMWLLARLARRLLWIAGFGAHAVGTGLHAVALRFGALSLVQPLLVTSLVFALRAALDRVTVSRRTLLAAALTTGGLAVFLLAAHPPAGQSSPDLDGAATVLIVGLTLTLTCLVAERHVGARGCARCCSGWPPAPCTG